MYKQRLHVKKFFLKFLNSIKLFLLFSTEISSTEYRDVAYVQYRDVQVPRCPDTFERSIKLKGVLHYDMS
jgi:hypothetical protein